MCEAFFLLQWFFGFLLEAGLYDLNIKFGSGLSNIGAGLGIIGADLGIKRMRTKLALSPF